MILKQLIVRFYCLPLFESCLLGLAGVLLWYFLMLCLKDKEKLVKMLSALLLVTAIGVVIASTLFSREKGEYSIRLIPFQFLWNRTLNWDATMRPMIMNVILFVPVGVSAPFLFGSRTGALKRIIIVSLGVFHVSAVLEVTQLLLHVGTFETDDILCNTIGAVLGMLPYLICDRYNQCRKDDEMHAN